MSIDFDRHRQIVSSCVNEAELHSNWFTTLAACYFDLAKGEIQHERRGPKGIIDAKLVKGNRCRIAVELKSPEIEGLLESHFLQAHQYAFSFNFFKDGMVVHPLGILTNGKKAIVFDGSISKTPSEASKEVLDLSRPEDYEKLCSIFQRVANGELGHPRLHKPEFIDTRPVGVLDKQLQSELKTFHEKVLEIVEEPVLAFDYWVQLFLISVLRDHGIVPNAVLRELEQTANIRGITLELNRLLNENFIPLNNEWSDLMWQIYGETGRFCTRLNLLNADTLGFAYESILKIVHGSDANSTSVYTPEDLAIEMIERLTPNIDDVVIDSASGTGTLLCVVSEIAWKTKNPWDDPDRFRRYFEDQIIAVDRDIYALKCCKAMLLCTFVKILDADPSELSASWSLPKLKHLYHTDLFDARINKSVTLAVGNPPWGNIDAPENRIGLKAEHRKLIKEDYRNVYSDDSDICIYVVRHMLAGSMFRLANGFRAGFLIKQQVLTNVSHTKFRQWANDQGMWFVDHGSTKRFPHSQASLVAECFFGVVKSVDAAKPISEPEGVRISDLVVSALGFQPSLKDVYISLANRITGSDRTKWVKPMYPTVDRMKRVVWNSRSAEKIMFVPRGTAFPGDVVTLTANEKSSLKGRAQVAQKFPFSWRGCEKIESYGPALKNPRIYMPRDPATAERMVAGIDLSGSGIGTSGHTIWIKRDEVPLSIFKCLVAWLNSKSIMEQLEVCGVSRRAHGFTLTPSETRKLLAPEWVFTEEVRDWVDRVIQAGDVTAADLATLDDFAIRSDLTPLESDFEEMLETQEELRKAQVELERIHAEEAKKKRKPRKKRA